MKPARLISLLAIALLANPAVAAVNPWHSPAPKAGQKQAPGVEALLQVIVETDTTVLPLECRGYYVRMKSNHASGSLNRCN